MNSITSAYFEALFPVAVTGFRVTPPRGRCRPSRVSACFVRAGDLPMMRNGLDAIVLPEFQVDEPDNGNLAASIDGYDYLTGGIGDDLSLRRREMAPFAWA